jgi:peptidoglycan hydrolase CwlO-like protein
MLFQIIPLMPSSLFALIPLQFSFDLWGEKGGILGLIIAALLFMQMQQNNRVYSTFETTLRGINTTLTDLSKSFVASNIHQKSIQKDVDDIKQDVGEIKMDVQEIKSEIKK